MSILRETDWRAPAFRENMRSKIEDATRIYNANYNAGDLESQIFSEASSKGKYMSLVCKIINHMERKHKQRIGLPPPNPLNLTQTITAGQIKRCPTEEDFRLEEEGDLWSETST